MTRQALLGQASEPQGTGSQSEMVTGTEASRGVLRPLRLESMSPWCRRVLKVWRSFLLITTAGTGQRVDTGKEIEFTSVIDAESPGMGMVIK